MNRLLIIALAALIVAHAALLCSSRLHPFTDLPNHLAAATIHRCSDEPGSTLADYYTVDLFLRPNIIHILFCGSPLFPSVEFANRVFLACYVVLLPLSVLLLIRRLGGNPWFSLLSFLLLGNYNLMWGFVGFVFAVPLVLLTVLLAVPFVAENRLRYGWCVAAAAVLLFFVHALMSLFAVLVYLVYCFSGRGTSLMRRLARGAAAAPALVLLAWWWLSSAGGSGLAGYLATYYRDAFLRSYPARISLFYLDNYHLLGGLWGRAVGGCFSACIIAPALAGLLERRDAPASGRAGASRAAGRMPPTAAAGYGDRSAAHARRAALVLCSCALACFLLLPRDLPGQAILYQRFSSVLLLSVVVLAAVLNRKPIRAAAGTAIIAVCMIHFLLFAGNLVRFNRENEGFTPSLLPDRAGLLAGIVADPHYRGWPAYIHFPSYHIVWKRHAATTRLVDYRFSAVRRKAGGQALPPYDEWFGKHGAYNGRYRGAAYLLARGVPPPETSSGFPGFTLVRVEGRWSLYERSPFRAVPER